MEFHQFDAEYLRRLRVGDPQTEAHFANYFGELIYLKLRRRLFQRQLLEDIRQETLCRVLKAVREKEGAVDDPRKFGAFVNGVCHYVTAELTRAEHRYLAVDDDLDPPDRSQDLNAPLIDDDRRREVQKVLARLDDRDRRLLRAIFLDEMEAPAVCRQFGVSADYLRVLVFRAKAHFRQEYARRARAATP